VKIVVILLCKLWQKAVSPFIGSNCRFYPSCSDYMIESVQHYGAFKGFYKGMLRVCRCNSLSKVGFDPVKTGSIDASNNDVVVTSKTISK